MRLSWQALSREIAAAGSFEPRVTVARERSGLGLAGEDRERGRRRTLTVPIFGRKRSGTIGKTSYNSAII